MNLKNPHVPRGVEVWIDLGIRLIGDKKRHRCANRKHGIRAKEGGFHCPLHEHTNDRGAGVAHYPARHSGCSEHHETANWMAFHNRSG